MLKKIFKTKFHLRFAFNPYLRFRAKNFGSALSITNIKRKVPLIVSLTSYEERFDDLELTILSLMTQTIKPDRIILWLSDELQSIDIPYSITHFNKNGLEIRFVKDIGSYTKIIYTLKEFSDSIIVTADDDIIYPKYWLERLYHSYISNPNDIHCHRAHRVLSQITDKRFEILPYKDWDKHVKEETARYDNFLTGVGGVLYPPNCFIQEVFRNDIYLKYCKNADDIWLWIMGILSDRKIRVVKNHIGFLTCTNIFRQLGVTKSKTLASENLINGNDRQLKNVMQLYNYNIQIKLS